MDLAIAIEGVYIPAGMRVTKEPIKAAESSEYGAASFALNDSPILFRIAKTTPTKVGQFVTLWKRACPKAPITPFDESDEIAFVIVNVCDGASKGQFIFDQEILLKKGIFSKSMKGGKLAFRLYAPSTHPTSKMAIKTQEWQRPYFLPFMPGENVDLSKVRSLLKRA